MAWWTELRSLPMLSPLLSTILLFSPSYLLWFHCFLHLFGFKKLFFPLLRSLHFLDRCCTAWTMPPALLYVTFLNIGSPLLPKPACIAILLFYASYYSWNDRHKTLSPGFFPLRWGLINFFALADLEPQFYLSLTSLAWLIHATMPSYWLRWGILSFCPDWPLNEILPILTSQVARISGISHQHPASPFIFIKCIIK
jgi:hypothetical protein